MNRAVLIGAGIGGLTAAIALRQAGWEVEVCERAPELKEVGSGLSLWKNALAALAQLGLYERARALGIGGQLGEFRRPDGKVLLTMRAADTGDTSAENVILLLHRAELLALLVDAAGRETIRLNACCTGFEQSATGVTARFADGRTARADLLIGADGLRSVVRPALFGAAEPRYGGYTTWRAITQFPVERLLPGETWGRGRRFGQWGMTGGRAYWYATHTVPAEQGDPTGGRKRGLQELFHGWHAPIAELIEATPEAAVLRTDVYDRPALPRWSVGRATLLGDAAHPMTPDMGQGACQAIEDAVILADCLRTVADIPAALQKYERLRIRRTSRVVKESRNAGWIAQWSHPLACRFREALLSSSYVARQQSRQLAWLIAPQR